MQANPFYQLLALAGTLPKPRIQGKGRDMEKRRKWFRIYKRKRRAEGKDK